MNLKPITSVLKHNQTYVCISCRFKNGFTACWHRPLRHASTARVILPTFSPEAAAVLYADIDKADRDSIRITTRKRVDQPEKVAAKRSKAKKQSLLMNTDKAKLKTRAQEAELLSPTNLATQSTDLAVSKTKRGSRKHVRTKSKPASAKVTVEDLGQRIESAPKSSPSQTRVEKHDLDTSHMTARKVAAGRVTAGKGAAGKEAVSKDAASKEAAGNGIASAESGEGVASSEGGSRSAPSRRLASKRPLFRRTLSSKPILSPVVPSSRNPAQAVIATLRRRRRSILAQRREEAREQRKIITQNPGVPVDYPNTFPPQEGSSKDAFRSLKGAISIRTKESGLREAPRARPLMSKAAAIDVAKLEKALFQHEKNKQGLTSIESEIKQKLLKSDIKQISAEDYHIKTVDAEHPTVPSLAYGLDRVLFNPGVYHLQDPRSRVFNFDPYLQTIMPVSQFDFSALKEYITSSRDASLKTIAEQHGKRYVGSTSSMTGILAHFHFLLSQWREITTSMVSRGFPDQLKSFTLIQRCPSAIFLKWKDGTYAIDADKEFATSNILSMLGKAMEKLLTLSTEDFERYRRSNKNHISEEERIIPEAFHYSTMGDFLMRSQLDAHDPRLPGSGMFDLKTRAVVTIRMDIQNVEQGAGYEIKGRFGEFESFEREYFDMIRSAFLKYSLQVRMGRMDGIFVAFHNTERIFGFQYISLEEMDFALHGQTDPALGDQEFKLSLELLNQILDRATKRFPEQSIRIHFETREATTPFMYVFSEPVTDDQMDELQTRNQAKIEDFERELLGLHKGDESPEDDNQWEEIQAKVEEAIEKDERGETEDTETRLTTPEPSKEGLQTEKRQQSSSNERADDSGNTESPNILLENAKFHYVGSNRDVDVSDGLKVASQINAEAANNSAEDGVAEAARNVQEDEKLADEENKDSNATLETDPTESKAASNNSGSAEAIKDELKEGNAVRGPLDTADENAAGELDSQPSSSDDAKSGYKSIADDSQDSASDASAAANTTEPIAVPDDSAPSSQASASRSERDSASDTPSINDLAAERSSSASSTHPPVLAMVLTIRNKIDGKYVTRPEPLVSAPPPRDLNNAKARRAPPPGGQKWSVEYTLTDVQDPERAWTLYQACQARRRKKLDPAESDVEDARNRWFMAKMKELSAKGKRWREGVQKRDEGREVVVLGRERGESGRKGSGGA